MISPAPFHHRRDRRDPRGFTLIELLVVMAIIAVLGAMVFISPSLTRSTSVTTAGNMVTDDLAFARELAISSNQKTEVWFLRPTGQTFITALQLFTYDQNGAATSYGPVHHLPASIGLDSGTLLSPLFSGGNKITFVSPNVPPTITGFPTYTAWRIGFMPDGSTTSTTQWFFTLHDVSLGDQLAILPNNYAVVSVDAVTGAVSLYRP